WPETRRVSSCRSTVVDSPAARSRFAIEALTQLQGMRTEPTLIGFADLLVRVKEVLCVGPRGIGPKSCCTRSKRGSCADTDKAVLTSTTNTTKYRFCRAMMIPLSR